MGTWTLYRFFQPYSYLTIVPVQWKKAAINSSLDTKVPDKGASEQVGEKPDADSKPERVCCPKNEFVQGKLTPTRMWEFSLPGDKTGTFSPLLVRHILQGLQGLGLFQLHGS